MKTYSQKMARRKILALLFKHTHTHRVILSRGTASMFFLRVPVAGLLSQRFLAVQRKQLDNKALLSAAAQFTQ